MSDPAREPMLVEGESGVIAQAARRLSFTPVPAWVRESSFDRTVPSRSGFPVTWLLHERITAVEQHTVTIRVVHRLETLHAVRTLSNWQTEFDPHTDVLAIHSIAVRRGEAVHQQAAPGRVRLLQREEGLEAHTLGGRVTALLVLEDVRVGDVIDACYSFESRRELLAHRLFDSYSVSLHAYVARFRLVVTVATERAVRWKTSAKLAAPVTTVEGGLTTHEWSGNNLEPLDREPLTPHWHRSEHWVDLSDCADWGEIARAVHASWPLAGADPRVASLVDEIARAHPSPDARAARAIELVQDQFRYLSEDVGESGIVPSAPGIVAARRFGDCKDLACLLTLVLRGLGLEARPVLVSFAHGGTVRDSLPSPFAFDHVIVEYRAGERIHWVDATCNLQGGGASDRVAPHFGVGLPVDASATGLVDQPPRSAEQSSFELRETLLIDTSGAPSLLGVVWRMRGAEADTWRARNEAAGAEQLAKDRLEYFKRRYGNARKSGAIEYRDDRERNEIALAESFEVEDFLIFDAEGGCVFPIPMFDPLGRLRALGEEARQAPIALRFGTAVHTLHVCTTMFFERRQEDSRFVAGPLTQTFELRASKWDWVLTSRLVAAADSLAQEQLAEYRRLVEQAIRGNRLALHLQPGVRRMKPERDFAQLPPLAAPMAGGFVAAPVATSALSAAATVRVGTPMAPSAEPVRSEADSGNLPQPSGPVKPASDSSTPGEPGASKASKPTDSSNAEPAPRSRRRSKPKAYRRRGLPAWVWPLFGILFGLAAVATTVVLILRSKWFSPY